MNTIAHKLLRRRFFIPTALLAFSLLVFQTAQPRGTAHAVSEALAARSPADVEAPRDSSATQPSRDVTIDSAESLIQRGDVSLPPIPLGGGGGGGAKVDAGFIAKNGPFLLANFIMSRFTIKGFMKGKEPFVFLYSLEANSTAEIILQPAKNAKQSYRLHLQPTNGEIKEVKGTLPEWFGEKPQVGVIFVKALKNGPEPRKDAVFVLAGTGFGGNAIGSLVIDQIRFQPGSINPNLHQKASYSFRSLSDLDLASVDVEQVIFSPDVGMHHQNVKTEMLKKGVRRGESVTKEWDGKNSKGKISLGQHQVFVRAWNKPNNGADWTCVLGNLTVSVVKE